MTTFRGKIAHKSASITNCAKPIPKLVLCFLFLMSLFYQVLGSTRCPKIKRHAGIKLRPANKAKEPYVPGDLIIISCETTEITQSIKCQEDGRWSDVVHCPDPTNSLCPDLPTIPHGSYNATGPYKFGTIVAVKCENDDFNLSTKKDKNETATTTTVTAATLTSPIKPAAQTTGPGSIDNRPNLVRYNLTGYRYLKCLASSRWNHEPPTCTRIPSSTQSSTGLFVTSFFVILIPILILIAIAQVFLKLRKRKQQRERWKQYFTDYKYRYSKTNMTFANRLRELSSTVPVTDL